MDKKLLTSSSNLFNSSSRQVISNTAYYAVFAYAADVNGDGDMDVLSASHLDDTIAVSYTHRRCRRSTLCRSRWSPYH